VAGSNPIAAAAAVRSKGNPLFVEQFIAWSAEARFRGGQSGPHTLHQVIAGRIEHLSKVRIAEAGSEIDAAWLQLTHNIDELYQLACKGEKLPFSTRLRVRRDQVRGTERSIAAIDRLFENSGGRALQRGTPIQRFWRDAHAGRVHAANDAERAYVMFGTGAFGLPVENAMV
jgi:hypothetical protein